MGEVLSKIMGKEAARGSRGGIHLATREALGVIGGSVRFVEQGPLRTHMFSNMASRIEGGRVRGLSKAQREQEYRI
jgi:hypothetical protein